MTGPWQPGPSDPSDPYGNQPPEQAGWPSNQPPHQQDPYQPGAYQQAPYQQAPPPPDPYQQAPYQQPGQPGAQGQYGTQGQPYSGPGYYGAPVPGPMVPYNGGWGTGIAPGEPCPACGMPFGVGIACQSCAQVSGMPVGVRLSSLGKRFGEYLLTCLLVIVTLVIGYIIWDLILWEQGTTPAKKLLGMQVISTETRQPATFGKMALRSIVGKGIVSGALGAFTFGIGQLVAICLIFGSGRQALWDKIASTVVVDVPPSQPEIPSYPSYPS